MNYAQMARTRLGLSLEEFGLLISVPASTVEEWEGGEVPEGAVKSLLILLSARPHQCAEVLIEYRMTFISRRSPEFDALTALVRKIHACHVV